MSGRLSLSIQDETCLRRLDQAFDEKTNYQKFLEESNVSLSQAAQNWCKRAKENHRAMELWRGASIVVSLLFVLTWAAIIWAVLHG